MVREVRPQVLVTYDTFGGYGHPDHIQAHRVAMYARAARRRAAFRPDLGRAWDIAKIYWAAIPRSYVQQGIEALDRGRRDRVLRGGEADELPFLVDDELVTTRDRGRWTSSRARWPRCASTPPRSSWTARSSRWPSCSGRTPSGREFFILVKGVPGRHVDEDGRETDLFAGLASSTFGHTCCAVRVNGPLASLGLGNTRSWVDAQVQRREAPVSMTEQGAAQDSMAVLDARSADVGREREVLRRKRLTTLAALLAVPAFLLWRRILTGDPFDVFAFPAVDPLTFLYVLFIVALIGAALIPLTIGMRSPHVLYRPEQLDVRLSDVVGIDTVRDEVVHSLNLFLSNRDLAENLGGRPRRGVMFEGAPGTGKTHTAKALAAEADVPFLFASGTAFHSSFQGATARKIRSYFRALRKVALQGGRRDRVHRRVRRDRR